MKCNEAYHMVYREDVRFIDAYSIKYSIEVICTDMNKEAEFDHTFVWGEMEL